MTDPQSPVVQSVREVWFWSGIFRDHATFIYDNLAPGQDELIRWAAGFRDDFAAVHDEVADAGGTAGLQGPAGSRAEHGTLEQSPLEGFGGGELRHYDEVGGRLQNRMLELLPRLYNFKQQLLQQKLDCRVKLNLGPTLLAHMIMELEEAHRILGPSREEAPLSPTAAMLHQHVFWLRDTAGHAAVLGTGLDKTEAELREQTQAFTELFDGMYLKANELATMLRAAPRLVGALRRLNRDSATQVRVFRAFLTELREHLEGCEVMGTLTPQLADHMVREELYYSEKVMDLGVL